MPWIRLEVDSNAEDDVKLFWAVIELFLNIVFVGGIIFVILHFVVKYW